MRDYADKDDLCNEIKKTADAFIEEFTAIPESDGDFRLDGVDRTPREMIAYQLGWMELLQGWDRDEREGKTPVMPAPGFKWNRMGELYETFYVRYASFSLQQLRGMFDKAVDDLIRWLRDFSDDEIFRPGGRKWAASVPSNWPIWKWVHINTVAPFGTFRAKIRKWNKLKKTV